EIAVLAREVDGLDVDVGVGELVGDVGQFAGAVLDQDADDFTLLEMDVGFLEGGAGRLDVVGDDSQDGLVAEGHAGHGLDVHAGAAEQIGHAPQLAGTMRQMDREVSHGASSRGGETPRLTSYRGAGGRSKRNPANRAERAARS